MHFTAGRRSHNSIVSGGWQRTSRIFRAKGWGWAVDEAVDGRKSAGAWLKRLMILKTYLVVFGRKSSRLGELVHIGGRNIFFAARFFLMAAA
ncbi:hypothetical protein KDL45_12255 [bacterium]|nr:hypothetical protein [bacterium]MCB9476129.1 hypothetical protein [Deltaproteobacteria bacterium]